MLVCLASVINQGTILEVHGAALLVVRLEPVGCI
jgi:hypothetical protein